MSAPAEQDYEVDANPCDDPTAPGGLVVENGLRSDVSVASPLGVNDEWPYGQHFEGSIELSNSSPDDVFVVGHPYGLLLRDGEVVSSGVLFVRPSGGGGTVPAGGSTRLGWAASAFACGTDRPVVLEEGGLLAGDPYGDPAGRGG